MDTFSNVDAIAAKRLSALVFCFFFTGAKNRGRAGGEID